MVDADGSLRRFLNPRSVAVVGASERNLAVKNLVEHNSARGVRFSLVNPRHSEVYGRPAVPALRDVDEPVDAVLSLVAADAAVDAVEQAVAIGAAGIIVMAANFAEVGEEGAQRQAALVERARAGGLAVIGPNCLGFYNLTQDMSLYLGPLPNGVRAGNVAIVSQSGGMLTASFFGAAERRIGLSYAISSGNEAVTDMCDLMAALIDDPHTDAIGLAIEQVRRPELFVELAYRAREAGKAIIALKLGRSKRAAQIAQSHTGALMQDARAYDAAFKQCGVGIALDIDDLLDQLQLFSHWPPEKWRARNSAAVVTASGGSAGQISDAFDAAGAPLVEDAVLAEQLRAEIPGCLVTNPVDVTGIHWNSESLEGIYGRYLASDAYDTLIVAGYLDERQEAFAQPMVDPMVAVAGRTDKRLVMMGTQSGRTGLWVDEALLAHGIAAGRGVRETLRSLTAMERFARSAARPRVQVDAGARAEAPRAVKTAEGQLGRFDDTMDLLRRFGIPTVPYVAWPATADDLDRLAAECGQERFVVKLANVLHRTELGAVRLGVGRDEVPAAAEAMIEIARREGVAEDVVVQGQLDVLGEVFVGIQARSVFGPVVLTGIGGVFLEVLNDSTARLAPFGPEDAEEMLAELAGSKVLHGVRGADPWHPEQLIELLVNASKLAVASSAWLDSMDINPIVVHRGGLAAVDGACLLAGEPLEAAGAATTDSRDVTGAMT